MDATALADLESAEDFLEYFAIPFDPQVVRVNRLHILQRFRDYLERLRHLVGGAAPRDPYRLHRHCLERAYQDFVHSDARTEQVFAVFRRAGDAGCGACSCASRLAADGCPA